MTNPFQNANADSDSSVYFIGSSRLQKSLDPKILQDHFANFQIMNLGISGSNFLSNCVMAEIVLQRPGHNILFIELAPILEELPDGVYRAASQTAFSPLASVYAFTANQSYPEQSRLMLNILNRELYKSVTIREEVFDLAGYSVDVQKTNWIGFDPYDKNEWHDSNSFLTWQEINAAHPVTVDLEKYSAMISRLDVLAKRKGCRIVFFLPITVREPVEKHIILPLYHTLQDSMKFEFTSDFMSMITQSAYLGDQNHLNRKGAEVYSRSIVPLLQKHLEKYVRTTPNGAERFRVGNR